MAAALLAAAAGGSAAAAAAAVAAADHLQGDPPERARTRMNNTDPNPAARTIFQERAGRPAGGSTVDRFGWLGPVQQHAVSAL